MHLKDLPKWSFYFGKIPGTLQKVFGKIKKNQKNKNTALGYDQVENHGTDALLVTKSGAPPPRFRPVVVEDPGQSFSLAVNSRTGRGDMVQYYTADIYTEGKATSNKYLYLWADAIADKVPSTCCRPVSRTGPKRPSAVSPGQSALDLLRYIEAWAPQWRWI